MLKAIVISYLGIILFASVVFIGAGRLSYWQGELYLGLALIGATISHVLVPQGSTLTADRARDAQAGQDWDKRLLRVLALASMATFLVAGLDSGRFGWTGPVPIGITVAGVVLMLAGQMFFALAKRENAFFSSTVRIQAERGHRPCETGPYRLVRHPGYLGMLASMLAFPLVMNSYWSFVPTTVGVAVLMRRTVLEDRYLTAELPGYADYARRTSSMLVPGLF